MDNVNDESKWLMILDVPVDSSLDVIKSQFKKLAKKYHPDKCRNNPELSKNFGTINAAYYGLMKLYSKRNDKKDKNDTSSKQEQQQKSNEFPLQLTLEELFHGCVKQEIVPWSIDNKIEEKCLTVTIQAGTMVNTEIKVQDEDNQFIFIVKELEHPLFKRNRYDLIFTKPINVQDTFKIDYQITVPTIDGEDIPLLIDQIVTSTTEIAIPNRGMPYPIVSNGKRGKMIVKFSINYEKLHEPKKSDSKQPSINEEKVKCLPTKVKLALTLEEILNGVKKKIYYNQINQNCEKPFQIKEQFVEIPPGVPEDYQLVLKDEGNQEINKLPGDVIVSIKTLKHQLFERDGIDLIHRMKIYENQTKHPLRIPGFGDCESINIKLWLNWNRNGPIRIVECGLPLPNKPEIRGDIVVHLDVMENPKTSEWLLELTLADVNTGVKQREMFGKRAFIDQNGSLVYRKESNKIDIERGIEDGTKIIISWWKHRASLQGPKPNLCWIPFDVVINVEVLQHQLFKRDGPNLIYTISIVENEFNKKLKFKIPCLGGSTPIDLKVTNINENKLEHRIPNFGLPIKGTPYKGDLIVKFRVVADKFKAEPIIKPIEINLKDLCKGTIKNISITRKEKDVFTESITTQTKSLKLKIPAGTKPDTKFTFNRMGDDSILHITADLIYIIKPIMPKPRIIYHLWITLEDVLYGCTKQHVIRRTIIGQDLVERVEAKELTIKIKPGITNQERIILEKSGDHYYGFEPIDVHFYVNYENHPTFHHYDTLGSYKSTKLCCYVKFDWKSRVTFIDIPALGKEKFIRILAPKEPLPVTTIKGQGLPYSHSPDKRDDLEVRWIYTNVTKESEKPSCSIS
ncbi:hypothetical protein RDWZM_009987 [Blomia tropicalis]|uniref:J domain-containing protein n=1 Tax=Blomia tropicalis TaxID=40697 RepID=A0A9Q0M035_BLOTA|nr:hypothetical protein RDWZM_009987 [Blomia tropicalis]